MGLAAEETRGPARHGVVGIAIAAFAAIAIYLLAFGSQPVRNLGTDSFGYVAQIRAARSGVLDLHEERPGVAVTGALLSGIGLTPALTAPIVVSIALAACFGIAAAAAAQAVFGLPTWTVGPIGLVVATWGGTTRLAAGYLANLTSLPLFLVGVALILLRGPGTIPVGVAAILVAALFAHPGLVPAYAAIVIAWAVVAVPILRRDRAAGIPAARTEPAVATWSLAIAAVVGVLVLGGWIGLGIDDVAEFAGVRGRFDERAAEIVAWIRPWLTLLLAAAGAVAVRRSLGSRLASLSARVGIAWLAVAVAGAPLLVVAHRWPFHRLLLLGVPAAILIGIAVVSPIRWVAARSAGISAPTAALLAFVVAGGLAVVMVAPFAGRASRARPAVPPTAAAVAGYLRAADVSGPVILVTDPTGAKGVRDWKRRQNAVRALAPSAIVPEVVLYLGDERLLLQGRPTRRHGDPSAELFDQVSLRTWPDVRAVRARDPTIVVARPWVSAGSWRRVTTTTASVAGELAILRGPSAPNEVRPVGAPPFDRRSAAIRIVGVLIVLWLVGGGWARVRRSRPVQATAFAPMIGLTIVILVGVLVGAFGGDPGGSVGVLGIGAAGLAGWILTLSFHPLEREPVAPPTTGRDRSQVA